MTIPGVYDFLENNYMVSNITTPLLYNVAKLTDTMFQILLKKNVINAGYS